MPSPPTIPELAAALGAQLRGGGGRLATVESCTGGAIAHAITGVAGSSGWFERGFVTYSNAAKREMVGVPGELIDRHGAVSVEVAAAMAAGGIRHSHADHAIAITGIAGPDGGSAAKPVGTVCLAWVCPQQAPDTERMHFAGDRQAVCEQGVAYALAGLLRRL